MRRLFFVFALASSFYLLASVVRAESCSTSCTDDSLDKCIAECNKLLNISVDATKPHEQRMDELQATIDSTEKNLETLTVLIDRKKNQINDQETKLANQQALLNTKIRNYYEKSYQFNINYLLSLVFSSGNATDALRSLSYWQNFINRDKQNIVSTVSQILDLNAAQKKLETDQTQLAAQKASLEVTLAPIKKLVADAKAYQSQLAQTVGDLSARQQALITARLGSLGLSRSAGISMACSDDRNIDPGFSPRLAFYTFGVPHRVGMSQFGAYGRAKGGQNYQDILRAYFNGINFEKKDNIDINVDGFGKMSLEQYMLGIYEVPDNWPMDALKAQAVAARSYARAYTNNGANSICTSQECQVYKGGNKGGNWEQAVKQTDGEVMTNGGQAIKAWYSSTDGGYTHTSAEVFGGATAWTKNLRDTNGDVGSISDLQSKAYDRDSPCFYNAQGWRKEYNKSAWLKPEEVADIVNVILLSAYNNNWDTLSSDDVKNQLRSHGATPFNLITNVSMNFDWGSGKTTSVTLSGDAGSKTVDGTTFKNYFNVRAPANIAIVGPLFNIEKK